jgi:hypothetical protein
MLTILSIPASSFRRDSRMRSNVTRTSCSKLMGSLSDGIATPTWPATKIQLPASVSIRSASLKLLAIGLARCCIALMIGPFPVSVSMVAALRDVEPEARCPDIDVWSFWHAAGGVARAFVVPSFELLYLPGDVRYGA